MYKLTPNGADYTESVLYSFRGGQDGANPYAELEFGPAGPLYGTTQYGGPNNAGTVFELISTGSGYSEDVKLCVRPQRRLCPERRDRPVGPSLRR